MLLSLVLPCLLLGVQTSLAAFKLPSKFHGVNLGGWLVTEAWMNPSEWLAMGGENCTSCDGCVQTEAQLVAKLGQTKANTVFAKHWKTWFTQKDVTTLKSLGINAVRIPLGYWIFEDLVEEGEAFPQGGLAYLKTGVKMLSKAGIAVVLDLHALPGAQTPNQMFIGQCAPKAEFYNQANFARALKVGAALTALMHADSDFKTAFSVAPVNEPMQDQTQTPGLLDFYKAFSGTVRATEKWLGMSCGNPRDVAKFSSLDKAPISFVQGVLKAQGLKPSKPAISGYSACATVSFQDPIWQNAPYENNPVKAALGPTLYDDHLYFSFGGVANNSYQDTMTYLCNFPRFKSNAAFGVPQSSLFFGEWWIMPQWGTGPKNQIRDFADAQKLQYSSGAGWFFWNFKIEKNARIIDDDPLQGVLRDYVQSVKQGYLPKDPKKLWNKDVCKKWIKQGPARPTSSLDRRAVKVDI